MKKFALGKHTFLLLAALVLQVITYSILFNNPTVFTGDVLPDTEAPSIPANLSYVSKTTTSVALIWEPATDNVGVTGVDYWGDAIRNKGHY